MSDDLRELVADLTRAASVAPAQARAVVIRGAMNVKRDAQRFSAGISRAPHYPRSIGYDLSGTPSSIEAEVGPDKNKPQGPLGNIFEYGTSTSAPIAHLGPALEREAPRFAAAIEALIEDVL